MINADSLMDLLHVHSPSGHEGCMVQTVANRLSGTADSIETDVLGNVHAILNPVKGTDPGLCVMLEAHSDEIGYSVVWIDDDGYVWFRANGGIDRHCTPGSMVDIITRKNGVIGGIIGKKPLHLQEQEERNKIISTDQLWIDTGLLPEIVKEIITPGDPVVLSTNAKLLGDNKITSKALDDKVGVWIVTEAFKRIAKSSESSCKVVCTMSVQEEIGCRGAVASAWHCAPDIAIVVDVDFATDVPDCPKKKYGEIVLGKGPVISRHADCSVELVDLATSIADLKGIIYQISAHPWSSGGTDASKIQLTKAGVKTLFVGIPCRYMHTPVEMCDLRDIENAVNLIVELIESL